jgi:hypothetical protein
MHVTIMQFVISKYLQIAVARNPCRLYFAALLALCSCSYPFQEIHLR